ncbi:Hsp70 family protein [Pedosphaera parvula]|nr:Hsp70 family protein [Pedosphaera parvula]
MTQAPYIIGIDLGTTNCALASIQVEQGADVPVLDFPIPQLQRPGELVERRLLPSCLYVPGEHELPPGSTSLPWGESPKLIAGEFARWQGSRVPGRLVASAKSWLCHPGVDRSAPILPWGAPAELHKISPVEASAQLLAHLTAAWNFAHPNAPLAEQEVVITVPASFDEVARALTVSAARQAGLEKFTLVEEPQAAFYDFTAHHRRNLADALKDVRLVLVVDVGGGTTDFTLIQVGITPEGPGLRRIAVGDHLMLGGDNMDAALARLVEERLVAGGRKLSATQWTQLVQATRDAKESLLSASGPERHGIALVAEGSRLLGGTLSSELRRDETERLILDGFFPACAPDEAPRRAARVALQELGLPYTQEPAITRHLAAFLRQHAKAGFSALGEMVSTAALPRPDAILLNGGAFNSPKIAERLLEVVSSWWPDAPRIRLLPHYSLEMAVARGAAYYGLARRGLGQRIGGGAAHAFYVGLATEKEETTRHALCLIPRGHEEGQPVDLAAQPFTLTLGRPVQFPLFSTTADRIDRPGDLVEISEEFRALPPIHTLLKDAGGKTASVPVHLRAMLTELGTLELWCVSDATNGRWRLEFELRGAVEKPVTTVTEAMPARSEEAREIVERVYGQHAPPGGQKEAKQLSRTLEGVIGPRETWRLPLLRELWSTLHAGAKRRRRSVDHERVFLQLMGYSLRPGFGYALDDWRCEETFRLFGDGVTFHAAQPVWNEFWIMWRRVAGGLNEAQQLEMWNYLKPHLARSIPPDAPKSLPKLKGVQPQGLEEMVRTAASLEHLPPAEKVELGNWIASRLKNRAATAGPWAWALGRLGAREPIYGSSHKTVEPAQAAEWLSLLLEIGLSSADGTAFAVAQLARLTGDRARDLDESIRARAAEALKAVSAPEPWLRMITEIVIMEAADEARALGDSLPLGLQLR